MMALDVPRGWQTLSLGDLFDFTNGVNADKTAYGSGIPFANVLEVITHEALTDRLIPGLINLSPSLIARYRVRHGDVLFNRTSETQDEVGLASVYLGHSPTVFGGFVFRARPKTKLLDIGYSRYALRVYSVRQQIVARGQGGIRANIGQRDLKTVRVVVPPLADQRQIADVLAGIDHQIALLGGLILKKEAIKQGVMQQLLTGKTRLPGFTEPWSPHKLNQLGSFLKGRGIKRDDVQTSGVACIRYGELYTTYHDYTSTTVSFVNPTVASGALSVRHGDLLFAGSGETRKEIGMCVAFTGTQPAVAGGDIIVLRAPGVNPAYLAALINTPRVAAEKARLGQGDAVVHINGRALGSIEVDLPSRGEQDAIAQVIVDADNEIKALKARLTKAKSIKQGMMQQLLTGRTRLPITEEKEEL